VSIQNRQQAALWSPLFVRQGPRGKGCRRHHLVPDLGSAHRGC
jgi:hypothetical protein